MYILTFSRTSTNKWNCTLSFRGENIVSEDFPAFSLIIKSSLFFFSFRNYIFVKFLPLCSISQNKGLQRQDRLKNLGPLNH